MAGPKDMKQPKRFAKNKSPLSTAKGTGKAFMRSPGVPSKLSEKATSENDQNKSSKKKR